MEQFLEIMCETTSSESANTSGRTEDFLNSSASTMSVSENDEEPEKIDKFVQVIENYTDLEFRKHFRLNRSTANLLIARYSESPLYSSNPHFGLSKAGPSKEIYILLWYMANTNTFREIANLFNMSKSSAWRVIRRMTDWVLSIGHEFVQWPSVSKAQDNMRKFEQKKSIPNVMAQPAKNPLMYPKMEGIADKKLILHPFSYCVYSTYLDPFSH